MSGGISPDHAATCWEKTNQENRIEASTCVHPLGPGHLEPTQFQLYDWPVTKHGFLRLCQRGWGSTFVVKQRSFM